MPFPTVYEATVDELTRRIRALIPAHPEILKMDDPIALFKVEGFDSSDLNPSRAQAMVALAAAKRLATATPNEVGAEA